MNNSEFTLPLLHNTIGIMTPFLLAAIGGLFTELAGMLNIALEGLILIGAFFSVVFASYTGSLLLGVLMGIAVTMFVSWIFGAVSLYLKANVFISGLATNLLASGLTVVLAFQLFGNKGVILFENLPKLPQVHHTGAAEDTHAGGYPSRAQRFRLHELARCPDCVYRHLPDSLRVPPAGYRYRSGSHTRPGAQPPSLPDGGNSYIGALLRTRRCVADPEPGAFVPNISAGRGWIALVAIYLGNKRPVGILIAAFVFGLAESVSNYAQGAINVPADFILAFPYLITVAAMIIFSIWQYRKSSVL